MSERFVVVNRNTPMLMPPSLQEWFPPGHLVHFIIETVGLLSMHGFQVNTRGTGSPQFPPSMMLCLLIYNYAIGRMSSRQIEKATYEDVASRYICGGDAHPDHDTICTFRRQNAALFQECFVKVLEYAREMGVLAKRGGASVDGTKIGANASKHAAVSHGRAGEMIAELEREVQTLMAMAEQADREAKPETLKIPEEIARRETRLAKLKQAQAVIEERHAARTAEQQREYEAKIAEREAQRARGERVGGSDPKPPAATPDAKEQYNFTDPESRIMKAGNGAHFEQSYNAQAAVDTEGSMLVLGGYVTDAPNDKQQLVPAVQSVPTKVRELTEVLADSGFFSEAAVAAVEREGGPTVYAAVERTGHHRTIEDLLAAPEPETAGSGATDREAMRRRLRTATGRAAYKKRKETVEPVFGIIKAAMGFRRFLLRGIKKVSLEWSLGDLGLQLSPPGAPAGHGGDPFGQRSGTPTRIGRECQAGFRLHERQKTQSSALRPLKTEMSDVFSTGEAAETSAGCTPQPVADRPVLSSEAKSDRLLEEAKAGPREHTARHAAGDHHTVRIG